MHLALIGYGKMGKAIEEIAIAKGHTIVLKINSSNVAEFTAENLAKADVAIEFTNPHSAVDNIMACLQAGIPVVSGSTGWLDKWAGVEAACKAVNGSLLYASNFSVGVNIFFELNKKLASLMALRPEYAVSVEEIHHTQKKDAPSGTAITIAEGIMHTMPHKTSWVNKQAEKDEELTIISKRIDPAPGTHTVKYSSDVDDIEITHTAHNRKGFAGGAVLAAEFLKGKKGIFTMKEVLGL
ncbi:MAG: 4-hydroxy-tetrahydrodipicolinate reductase [Bacteroidetes bacterium]|nr:4-hydroxy-tetrahydrodipicolinate reductase [Bacteroidota bacterium]